MRWFAFIALVSVATARDLIYPLTTADAMMLDELNTIRSLIGTGYIGTVIGTIDTILNAPGDAINFVVNGAKLGLKELENVSDVLKENLSSAKISGFGDAAVNSSAALASSIGASAQNQVNQQLQNAGNVANDAVKTANDLKNQGSGVLNGIGNGLGIGRRKKKKRDIVGSALETASSVADSLKIKVPRHIFGPAANMQMLTWNRRLAQLAALSQNDFDKGVREIEYDGKKYRMFPHGSFAEYVAANLFGQKIINLFKYIKTGVLAMKMVLSGIDAPIKSEEQTKDLIFEALFADRTEVGCLLTLPNSFCIIGPIGARTGYLYKEGASCDECTTSCYKGMCRPPPDYALREKYQDKLKPNGDKFGETVKSSRGISSFWIIMWTTIGLMLRLIFSA